MQTKEYKKHHSFNTFFTNIKADITIQRQRVLDALKEQSITGKEDIISNIIADLTAADTETRDFTITQHIADELSRIDDNCIPRYVVNRFRYDVYPKRKMLDQFPPYLQIEPTSVCNFRCVFCYQTDQQFTTKANGYMGSMTFDTFKEIIDQCEGNVEFFSLASRGEPMLCKDIDQMVEYCVGKFLGLKVNTNASMLNEKHCHAILAGGVNTLVISADAAEEPLYSQLRVKGNLQKVLDNVKLFKTIKEKHYPQSKIITRVSGVKVGDDQNMDSMEGLWGELVDQVSFVTYNPWENVYDVEPNDITKPCSDLWRRMFVWYDGKVNPCDTDFKSHLSVGNLIGQTIPDLWRSEGYERLRKTHAEAKRCDVEPCKRCTVV